MALKCIVVDDEPLACRLIASYVSRTENLVLGGAYTSAARAFDAIREMRPDLVFLDIQMPEMTGLDIARRIPDSTKVVFTTAYRDYAVEGFRVNALDYLLKPVSYDEFLEAVSRATDRRASAEQFISVKSEYRLIRIRVADILYIEGLKDYIKIYVKGNPRPILTLMSMKNIENMLPPDTFMRVHRSYIANLSRAEALVRGNLVYGETVVPVSDSNRQTLSRRMNEQ